MIFLYNKIAMANSSNWEHSGDMKNDDYNTEAKAMLNQRLQH
jgi:hypothetical protein